LIDFSDSGIPLCENIGYNLLVFVLSSKRLAFCSFVFGLLRVWTAAGRLYGIHQNPWVDLVSSRIFLRSDASRHQLGTFVGIFYSTSWWDYQVGRYGKILSTTLRISLVLLSKSGHWLFTISMVGQRQRWSGDICDAVEAALLQRKERREQEVEEAALLSKSRLWRGIEGKDL